MSPAKESELDVNGIGEFHLTVPISDPEKTPKEADFLGNPQVTLSTGFEAGDPQNWFDGNIIEPFESTLRLSEGGCRMVLFLFKRRILTLLLQTSHLV
jgi:hypothetical protein